MRQFVYIVFKTRTDGHAMGKKLDAAHIAYEIMPTPRQFSTSCGVSLKIDEADQREAQAILAYSPDIRSGGIHKMAQKKTWFRGR